MIVYVLMPKYHGYYQIQNNDLQLKPKDDYKHDEFIVLYDEKILILLIYERSKMKMFLKSRIDFEKIIST
jgi:hypothetical protein